MLATYLHVLAVWLLVWVVFYGWGTLACRLARCDRDDATGFAFNPLIGLACVIGALQIWHFFAPVNAWACGFVFAIGVCGAVLGIGRLPSIGRAVRDYPVLTTSAAFLVLWLLNRSVAEPLHVDHGLYYLNTIRWMSQYPTVPGIVNLHMRLAFNNSSFLLHSMLEAVVGRGHSAHVVNGLMAAMALPIIIQGFRSVFYGSKDERQVGCFALAPAMLIAIASVDGQISSATPDFPASLLITLAAWRLLALGAFEAESQGATLRWNLLTIAFLASAALVVKTHVVFFATFAGIAVIAVIYRLYLRCGTPPAPATARAATVLAVCSLLFFAPWVARGYMMSGYPVFPSTIGAAPVDWKYDEKATSDLLETGYRVWFRTHDPKKRQSDFFRHGWQWVPEWLLQVVILRAPFEMVAPSAIAAASMLWLGYCALVRRRRKSSTDACTFAAPHTNSFLSFAAWLLAAAYVAAIPPWFFSAPGARFITFAMWGLAGVCLGMASRTIPDQRIVRYQKLLLAALAGLLLLPMLDEAVRLEVRYRRIPTHFMYQRHFYQHYPFVLPTWANSEDGFPPIPKGDLVKMTTNSGLEVYAGAIQEDGYPDLLWDSPLPAARFFNPNLELRRPGDLSSGFRTLPGGGKPYNAAQNP
jgi:hypothetical protein